MPSLRAVADAQRVRVDAFDFTPGSSVGCVLVYTSYDRLVKRTAYSSWAGGKIIIGQTIADEEGHARLAAGRGVLTGGDTGPGRVVVVMASDAGDLAEDAIDL